MLHSVLGKTHALKERKIVWGKIMIEQYKIYMDVCCLNRPFDDPEQERIRLEAEAILSILQQCQNHRWSLMNSDAIEFELEQTPDLEKIEQLTALLAVAQKKIYSNEAIEQRAEVLINVGFKLYDSLHIAFAEAGKADIMLTTDDRLLRRASRYREMIKIIIENPVTWFMNVTQPKGNNNNDDN
jgi:predicted nucleic acid-binding protein